MPVENVLLDNCHFTDITATSEAAVFNPLSLAQNVAITSCVFSQCSGKDAAAVLDIVVDSLSFSGNVFKLSVTTSSALHLALNTKSQKLSLTECTFNNSGSSVTGRFISIDDEHQDVEFTKCHFVDIGSESDGGGLKLSLTSEQAQLVAIECEFYGCFCTGSGGAIHGQSTWNIQLDQCTFDSCSCLHGAEQADNTAGGGGLFINDGTSEARLSSCRFINNRSPQNGQSILLVCQGETQFNRISFSSCTFIEHETGSIICFAYVDGGSLAVSNQDYVLTSCVFENNSLSGNSYLDDFGFFNGNSTGVVKYEYCSFINNVGSPRYVQEPLWDFVDSGIIVVSSKCTVFECEFDTCTLTNTVRGGVICVKETQGLVVERTNFTACSTASVNAIANQVTVEVDLCRFDYCISPTAPSVFSVQMINGVNRIDSVVISNCSITSCTGPPNGVFVHVRAISSHFENIKVNNGECPGCSGFVLSLQQGESASFDFCSFANVQMDHVIQGTSTTGGKVQFNNCSFSSITGNAGGVAVNGEYFGDLTLAGCEFTGIISNGAPVAISKITNAILLETSFDGCQSNTDGAGAVYFGNTFTSARVERCLFINNACANKCGQSLHFVLDNAKQYDMSIAFCTFREHNAGVPAIVLLCYAGQRETAYPYTVTLQNCFFQESVTGNLGLAQFLAQDVVYDSCEFTSISSGDNFGSRIVSLHSESALCTLRHCIFNKCTQSSQFSGILYFDVGSKVDVTVEDCEFNTCTSPSSMISVVSACLRSLNIYMSKFIECSCSSDSSAVLFAGMENEWTSYLPDLKFEMNTVTRCEGTSKGSVINFGPPTLSFRGNIFQLNQAGVESCIYVAAGSLLSGDYIFDNCTFDNNKQELSGQFIGLRAPRDLSFAACMFENLRGSNMGGLYIQRQSGGVRLDITGCSFINCAITGYSTGGGGAVFSGDVTLLTIWDSVFNGCKTNRVEGSNMGGGAIFVDASTKEGTIVNCTFVYNENADGMSIKVNAKENNPSRIDISNCTFSAHQQQTVGPIISFVYIEGNTPTTAPYEYRLSTCRFIDITVTENSGVVNIDAQSIVYENSSFVNTVVRRGAASLIVLGANTETCHLEHCHFESVQPSEKGMASLILMSSPLSQLALIESAFLGIYAGSGLISYSNGAKTLADPFFEMAVLTSCNFQDCQADSHVLNLNCQSCSIENNQFNSKSGATAPPLRIAVTNGKSTICNTSFTVSAESPATSLIQLACASGSEIEFYNCCFTHTAGTASGPLYLSMELEGKVTFSQVCFDVDKQFAISNTGSGTISYDGPESSFFGDNCQCWSSIDPTSEPTREPTTETTTETTSSSDPPSSGQTTEETDTPDAGTSKKSNAGLIAGVVIAVLVIIAVIVVLIIILLRRRGDNVTEEEAHSDQEFAEETAPSTNDSASNQAITDWSHTTEDNPLFTAENMSEMDDDNPFGDDFGEGFGGNPIE